mmetsp:Transcript_15962/g.30639  ORF Transcript_15962/g.30639 Transcript_15962/m.30639 type:complete len:158 (+) Transcript_15962:491-964(+)
MNPTKPQHNHKADLFLSHSRPRTPASQGCTALPSNQGGPSAHHPPASPRQAWMAGTSSLPAMRLSLQRSVLRHAARRARSSPGSAGAPVACVDAGKEGDDPAARDRRRHLLAGQASRSSRLHDQSKDDVEKISRPLGGRVPRSLGLYITNNSLIPIS